MSLANDETEQSVSKLSEKLLMGWTMLSETCTQPACHVPLMRDKPNGQCETKFNDDFKPILEVESVPKQQVEVQESTADMNTNVGQSSIRRRPRSESSSKELAEKLLQGWTLTDQYCPIQDCLTPLVRDRKKQLLCVSCDRWIVAEAEMSQQCVVVPPVVSTSQPAEPADMDMTPKVTAEVPEVITKVPEVKNIKENMICDDTIKVLLKAMNNASLRLESDIKEKANFVGEPSLQLLDFISNTAKTILSVKSVKDALE